MYLPKPLKALLMLLCVYVFLVLMFRYGRGGMSWGHSLLVGLAAAPAALLWGRLRGHWNERARTAGRRWREKRGR
ncbi:hypothetical protein ACF061_03250 [Streptomyces sp. NPDC015220]|uniref:hypothetical protein n=1 Tax=Streptomyces sp. NPDC015220 TaxID=3364947 RepID=UPI003701DC0B